MKKFFMTCGLIPALLLLTMGASCGSNPSTGADLLSIAVNTFIGIEIVDHNGTWTYTKLSTDLAAVVAGWPTATQAQKLVYVQTITADLHTVPGCDAKCEGYATIAINDVADVLALVNSGQGVVAAKAQPESAQVKAIYAKWQRDYKAARPHKG